MHMGCIVLVNPPRPQRPAGPEHALVASARPAYVLVAPLLARSEPLLTRPQPLLACPLNSRKMCKPVFFYVNKLF